MAGMLTIKPEQERKVEEEQERHQNEKTEISLAEIFFLSPEIKSRTLLQVASRSLPGDSPAYTRWLYVQSQSRLVDWAS